MKEKFIGCFGATRETFPVLCRLGPSHGVRIGGFPGDGNRGASFRTFLSRSDGFLIEASPGPAVMRDFFAIMASGLKKPVAIISPEGEVTGLDSTMISLFCQRGALVGGSSRQIRVFTDPKEAVGWLAEQLGCPQVEEAAWSWRRPLAWFPKLAAYCRTILS